MFRLLFKSSTAACFELENDLIYYADKKFRVVINGKKSEREYNTNIFSLFGLTPDTEYRVSVDFSDFVLQFATDKESCCLSVKDFGAVGDGKTLDTHAIQNAIYAVKENGRVLIPAGIYYTAPFVLKSNITLEIARGAKLLASADESDYPVWPGEVECLTTHEKYQCSTWEGDPNVCHQSFISAHHCVNIKIVGEGEIDGNGPNGVWYIDAKERSIGRPRLIFLNDCENVTCHGFTGSNSASWQMHPFFSRNIKFLDMRINAPKDSPNTDGCNPESCNGVDMVGVIFSVGDDCVAIKSGKIYMGKKYKTPSENITIRNCLMQYGHGGVVLGSEMSGGIKNLTVTHCLFSHTDRGLRIKTRRGRGKDAVIDGIKFERVRMDNVLSPIVINMFYFCDPDGKTEYVWSKDKDKYPADCRTPYLGKFHFKDIECFDTEYACGFFFGLPEQPIEEVYIENVSFSIKEDAGAGTPAMMSFAQECSKTGLCFNNVKTVKLKNVTFRGVAGEEVVAENVGSIIKL